MNRDTPVMVYINKEGETICRACKNSSTKQVIRFCSSLFIRTCEYDSIKRFDNTTCRILMDTTGVCKLNKLKHGDGCDRNMCQSCQIKEDAIRQYKQNNNL